MFPQQFVPTVHNKPVLTVPARQSIIERMVQSDKQALRDAFAARLKRALANKGIPEHGSGVFLKEATGVTPKAASKWLNAESTPGVDKMPAIARALGVRTEWLHYGVGEISEGGNIAEHPTFKESNVAPPPKMEGYVPVLTWIQAGEWTDLSNVDYLSDEKVPKPPGSSECTFALRVRGQSMTPKYDPGLIIYVDPGVSPYDGDDVVAILTEDNEAIFKQYVEEPGGRRLLKARNPSWPDPWIPINGNCEIIGVVIGFLWLRNPRAS
ncbi:helix-turn-helix domain-containing protein [Halomonas cupida]|uniref:helix-turn-helix domain-containing protein n=1 Tax=Halomonas cupida TaxID=44933 RepID=UPI0039B6915D